jgi:hypothetical protein
VSARDPLSSRGKRPQAAHASATSGALTSDLQAAYYQRREDCLLTLGAR